MAAALEARALGTDISIETCPHYLSSRRTTSGASARWPNALRRCAATPERAGSVGCSCGAAIVDVVASDHSPVSARD